MTSNRLLIRAAVPIIFGAIIAATAAPAFAAYVNNFNGDTRWSTERSYMVPPKLEQHDTQVGSEDVAQLKKQTAPVIAPLDNQIIAPLDSKVIGPIDDQIIAPIDSKVLGPTDDQVIAPADSSAIGPTDKPSIIPIQ